MKLKLRSFVKKILQRQKSATANEVAVTLPSQDEEMLLPQALIEKNSKTEAVKLAEESVSKAGGDTERAGGQARPRVANGKPQSQENDRGSCCEKAKEGNASVGRRREDQAEVGRAGREEGEIAQAKGAATL